MTLRIGGLAVEGDGSGISLGNIGTLTRGTVAVSAGTVIVSSGTVNISGGYTTPTHSATAITTSATVLAANANRIYAYLQNDGTASVYLSLGTADAVANTGIRLEVAGAYELSKLKGNLFTGAITGISAAGTSTVLVTEGV